MGLYWTMAFIVFGGIANDWQKFPVNRYYIRFKFRTISKCQCNGKVHGERQKRILFKQIK